MPAHEGSPDDVQRREGSPAGGDGTLAPTLVEQLPPQARALEARQVARGLQMLGVSDHERVAGRLEAIVPRTVDYFRQLTLSRLGELFWLNGDPVEDIAAHFQRIVFILMGRKLGGLTGHSTTVEGEARINLLVHFLELGVLNPQDFAKALFVFSGQKGEAEAFFSYFLTRVMKSGLPWPSFRHNMYMETDAAYSNENIVFSHDDVTERYGNVDGPVLRIICSTDYHILALLIAHGACDGGHGSPLAPFVASENCGDRVAFLSAPNPYRNNWDRGVRCSQRIMDATFYFAQAIQNNLGSIRDRLDPTFAFRKEERAKISEDRMRKLERSLVRDDRYARRVYRKSVELFEVLPVGLSSVRQSPDWPERRGSNRWDDTTSVGHRLEAIDQAITRLDIPLWNMGKVVNGRYRGLFGNIVNDLYEAVDAGEGVTFQQVDSPFQRIRNDIIQDIRWWGDPENNK